MNIKKILTVMLIPLGLSSWAQQTDSESKRWQDRIGFDLLKSTFSGDESIKQALETIREQHGFNVECDRGWFGMAGPINKEHCALGLMRVSQALQGIKVPVDPEFKDQISIKLTRPGLWRGFTYQNREMLIPFNATPQLMTNFITTELHLVYNVSLAHMMDRNNQLAKRIKSSYFVNVIGSPDLDVYQKHDALKKSELAMRMALGGNKPSREKFDKLGFDTIVLGTSPARLHEENGETRIGLNAEDHEGKMFHDIINAVSNPGPGQIRRVNLLTTEWSWDDVKKFRDDRNRVEGLIRSVRAALPDVDVECLWGAVSMAECRQGMDTLNTALAKSDALTNVRPDLKKIQIGALTLFSFDFQDGSKILLLDYAATPEKVAEGLTQNE